MLRIDGIVLDAVVPRPRVDDLRDALRWLARAGELHHLEELAVRVHIDTTTRWITRLRLESYEVGEAIRGRTLLGNISPELARTAAVVWVPSFEVAGRSADLGETFDGLRCYRLEDLGRADHLAGVVVQRSGGPLHRLARSDARELSGLRVLAETITGQRVAGSIPTWRLAALAERITGIDTDAWERAEARNAGADPPDFAFSYRVREVPATELRSL